MLLAGAQVPAVRTLLMLVVAAVGLMVARPGSRQRGLAVGAGRRARVGPVGGTHAGLLAVVRSRRRPALRGSRAPRVATARSRASRALAQGLRAAARTQAVVTVALVPGTLALFQQVSLVSPIANALAIPVVTFAVVPLALAAIVVPIDALWQVAHAVFAALMIPLDALAAARRGRVAATCARRAGRWSWRWSASPCSRRRAACRGGRSGSIALIPLFVVRPAPPAPGTFRMTVLDVGQGLAVVVETHRHALLYDTGPRYYGRRRRRRAHRRAIPARSGPHRAWAA